MNVADLHCDTISELFQSEKASLWENSLHLDIKKMQQGQYILQNFALFTDLSKTSDPYQYCMKMLDYFYCEMERWQPYISPVTSYDQILANIKQNKISALLTIEEGGVCQGELAHLRNFYRLGVRMMTLTWNYQNDLGFPNAVYQDGTNQRIWRVDERNGLTETGIAFVEEMEKLGMIIDISHLSDGGINDVIAHTKKPFAASHSNARSLAAHPRNLTDQMIKQMAERGCLIGINYCSQFLHDWQAGEVAVSRTCDMVRHMKHLKQVGGIGCIALGSDFDGIIGELEIKTAADLSLLETEMKRQGFSALEIEAVFYKNVLNFYQFLL